MPDDYSWFLTRNQLAIYSRCFASLEKYLKWYLAHGVRFGEILSTSSCFREMGLYMPRKKGAQNGTNVNNDGNNRGGQGSNAQWQWINIRLSDEDFDVLGGSDATLVNLALSAVSLADDGIGFKIEPTDEGKSIRATLYRSDFPSRGVISGVSSYADNVRDALLAALYKLDVYLGGDFSTIPQEAIRDGSRPRFR